MIVVKPSETEQKRIIMTMYVVFLRIEKDGNGDHEKLHIDK